MQQQTPNILHEWGRFDFNTGEADDNLIRLSIISKGNSFFLQALTSEVNGLQNALTGREVGIQKEYPLHKTIEQVRNLTADEALQLYYDAEKQCQGAS